MEKDSQSLAENRFVASQAADCTLLLEIGLHGFAMAVYRSGEWLMHDSLAFSPSSAQAARMEAAITHLKKTDVLYASFERVVAYFSDPYFTLLPDDFRTKAEPSAWMHFQHGSESPGPGKHNPVPGMHLGVAFSVMPEWDQFLKRNFGVVSEYHTLVPFLQWISQKPLNDITVWCYATRGGIFAAATNGAALLFANYFDVHEPEDFSYAVLMVYEVLSLNHRKPFRCTGKGPYLAQGMELLESFLPDAHMYKPLPQTPFYAGDFPFLQPLPL
jgi:hypothetical protein